MDRLAGIRGRVDYLDTQVSRLEGERDSVERLKREATERQVAALGDKDLHEQALKVLQGLEEAWRQDFQKGLASVVSQGLTAVFGEKMEVELESSLVRDVAATEIKLTVGDGPEAVTSGVLGSAGGSVVDVFSFLFRVLMLISIRPRLQRVLLLDEPFAHLDEYALPESVGQLLRNLAERLDVQMIFASHGVQLAEAADVAYEVKKKDGKANVRRLSAVHSS